MARARSNPLTEAEEAMLRHSPHMHVPRLVMAGDTRGTGRLDRLADIARG